MASSVEYPPTILLVVPDGFIDAEAEGATRVGVDLVCVQATVLSGRQTRPFREGDRLVGVSGIDLPARQVLGCVAGIGDLDVLIALVGISASFIA